MVEQGLLLFLIWSERKQSWKVIIGPFSRFTFTLPRLPPRPSPITLTISNTDSLPKTLKPIDRPSGTTLQYKFFDPSSRKHHVFQDYSCGTLSPRHQNYLGNARLGDAQVLGKQNLGPSEKCQYLPHSLRNGLKWKSSNIEFICLEIVVGPAFPWIRDCERSE